MKKFLSAVILCALCVSVAGGCSLHSAPVLPGNSYLAEKYPAGSITAVAEHLAETLAASYPPGHTALFIEGSGSDQDALGPALEASLRAKGFTVTPDREYSRALALVYVLDRLDEESWYSRLTLSDGLSVARTWRVAGDSLEMEGAAIRNTRTEGGHDGQ